MNSNLAFHKVEDNTKKLYFECVIGQEITHTFPFHIHHSLCIGLITKGKRWIVFPENELCCIQEGELFVINPLQAHAIQQQCPHDYVVITVEGLSDCPIFNQHIHSLQCKQLFVNLSDAIQNNKTEELSTHWDNLFDYLYRYQCKKPYLPETKSIITRTMTYISANYQNPITASDIAKYNCMSVFHFCRVFKSLMGISPHKYLMQYRLSKSRHCLQEKGLIFDTAIENGFYDSSHFIRNFYNNMAILPKLYCQSILKNSKNIQ